MIKVLFLLATVLGSIAVACGSSATKQTAANPSPNNGNVNVNGDGDGDGDTRTTTNQTGSGDIKETESEGQSKKDIKGTPELTSYHYVMNLITYNAGLCYGFQKKPTKGIYVTAAKGPCPDTIEVGSKKTISKMIVACPVDKSEEPYKQVFLYENFVPVTSKQTVADPTTNNEVQAFCKT